MSVFYGFKSVRGTFHVVGAEGHSVLYSGQVVRVFAANTDDDNYWEVEFKDFKVLRNAQDIEAFLIKARDSFDAK